MPRRPMILSESMSTRSTVHGLRPGALVLRAVALVGFAWLGILALFIAADELDGSVATLEKVTTQTGVAMEPTIMNGQTIRVVQTNNHERFDVVVYLAPDREDEWYVGRIVGLPGEVVEIRDGVVYIDGSILNEPHAHSPRTGSNVGPGRISAADYFILGDNRAYSRDSSNFGPVPIGNVAGTVEPVRARTGP
jgi:signal peptidase I